MDDVVEKASHESIYKQLIYRLENELIEPDILKLSQRNILASVLKLHPSELDEMLGMVERGERGMVLSSDFILVPMIGVANAGRPHDYPVPTKIYRDGSRVFFIQGDSMTTGDPESIRDGDWVLVDATVTMLSDGKVYLLELPGDGHTVKRARKLNGQWFLISDNPSYQSFKPDEARIVGQVYYAAGGRKV